MKYLRTVKLQVEVEAPTEFDANEMIADIYGSADSFGVRVIDLTVTASRKRK